MDHVQQHFRPPDREGMRTALQNFLEACGIDTDPTDFARTATRVTEIWCAEFLAGFGEDPAVLLKDVVVGEQPPQLVIVAGLRFHSMCPHHLVPYRGLATVGYLPEAKLAPFGRLSAIVDCFTKRLTLQERATVAIAEAIRNHLGSRGSGCVMEAEQLCLALPGEKHNESR